MCTSSTTPSTTCRARLMTTACRNCAGITDRRSVEEARCELAAWIAKWGMGYPRLVGWGEEIIKETLIFFDKELAPGYLVTVERIYRII